MLYVNGSINGTPIQLFVDSGAQTTIISKACAEKCGLLRLLDRRFSGTAVGVGSAPILGRVHMAPMVLGGVALPATFTVMERGPEILLGLDMLKRYQACIDLEHNVLRLKTGHTAAPGGSGGGGGGGGASAAAASGGYVSVPFLSEGELPKGHFGSGGGSAEGEEEGGAEVEEVVMGGGGGGGGGGASSSSASTGGGGGGAPLAAAGGAGAGGAPDEAAIAQLAAMGFQRARATRALELAGGSADRAAELLMEGAV
jgi:DNA damage-inducible protein 1